MDKKRTIVVTAALPYANGDIHIGHLLEYLQTDFWVRFQKMRGHDCVFVCADDTHGTPIMIRAKKEGITPEELIARTHAIHLKDFTDFEIAFDNYYSTNSPENKAFSEEFFAAMQKAGAITGRVAPQLYCEHCKMFLPDRYVKGTCPKCHAEHQYGDSCDKCGSTYAAEELGAPYCTQCGAAPVVKDAEQLYFELEPFHRFLQDWIPQHTASDIANKMLEWFGEPLRGWCISRAAPYFGFAIPGYKDRYFYVWVDAPIGYLASLKNWCSKNGRDFNDYWQNPAAERYHFIGKDIARFHCQFWPAMLHAAGYEKPTGVFVHGFLTVNGEKMAKTKGTFVNARTYLQYLPAWAMRYYYSCKLTPTAEDMDLNLDDFAQRVNADLVGKITNLASRGAQMLNKNLGGRLGTIDEEGRALVELARSRAGRIAELYEERKFAQISAEVTKIADAANQYFDAKTPWKTIKDEALHEATRTVLTVILNVFRIMAIYLKPILPEYAKKAARLFGEDDWTWSSLEKDFENVSINQYEYLATRIDQKQIDAMIAASKEKPAETGEVAHESRASKNKEKKIAQTPPAKDIVAFEDFEKLDLRVGTVIACETVEKSAKLLKFTIDAGALGVKTIFSGIRQAYPDAQELVGKQVLFIANLAPRKMSVGVSEGMILYAGEPGKDGGVLSPLAPVPPATPAT
ncbi:MAG: methionine--tRNA ligase [Kiritimatiellae bacterium]|nr:methionine--tRNA ligase [Kiritimatiellia bacterium]